jgi:hypothetical protein
MLHSAVSIAGFAFFTIAVARAEPIIVFDSGWNQNYAKNACLPFKKDVEDVAPSEAEVAAVFDCRTLDARALVARLEFEIEIIVKTRCKGVKVLRPELDGVNFKIPDIQEPHWKLMLYYSPGSNVQSWALLRSDNSSKAVGGEGTPAQIAEEVCIAVFGQPNIP